MSVNAHRKLPGSRRCLFRQDALTAWEDGADLEVLELADGGRIVRIRALGVVRVGHRTGLCQIVSASAPN